MSEQRPHDYAQIGTHRVIICDTEGCHRWAEVEIAEDGTAYCPEHPPVTR